MACSHAKCVLYVFYVDPDRVKLLVYEAERNSKYRPSDSTQGKDSCCQVRDLY
jgi:hypothetical protein